MTWQRHISPGLPRGVGRRSKRPNSNAQDRVPGRTITIALLRAISDNQCHEKQGRHPGSPNDALPRTADHHTTGDVFRRGSCRMVAQ